MELKYGLVHQYLVFVGCDNGIGWLRQKNMIYGNFMILV